MNKGHSLQQNWLPLVDATILQIDEIPLLGTQPPFNWDLFAENLKKTFQCKELTVTPKQWLWRDPKDLFEGLGPNLKTLQIAVSPLEGSLHWVMPAEDIKALMSIVLGSSIDTLPEELQEGFYSYIAAEVLHILKTLKVAEKLPLRLQKERQAPHELSLCLDIVLQVEDIAISGRLFLSSLFRKAWKRENERDARASYNPNVFLNVSLCIGHLSLPLQKLFELDTGDVLVISPSKYDIQKKQGACFLALNHSLLFNGTLQGNKIKIIEHLAKLEESSMTNEPPKAPAKEPLKEIPNETLQEPTNETSAKTSTPPIPAIEKNKPENPNSEPAKPENLKPENAKPENPKSEPAKPENPERIATEEQPLEEDASIFLGEDEEFFVEDAELSKVLKEELAEKATTEPQVSAIAKRPTSKPALSAAVIEESNESLSASEIPIIIKIEIATLSLPAKKVLELHPGNELSLDKDIDNVVRLIVNGKCIGKGELIQIGEVLGVRILEI